MDNGVKKIPLKMSEKNHTMSNNVDHMILHMTQDKHDCGGPRESEEEDTAGEGGDTPSLDSMTTDWQTDLHDPIDFIETHPRDFGCRQRLDGPAPHCYAHSFDEGVRVGRGVLGEAQYEKWSLLMQMEDGSKKGTFLPIHIFVTMCVLYIPKSIPLSLQFYPPSSSFSVPANVPSCFHPFPP